MLFICSLGSNLFIICNISFATCDHACISMSNYVRKLGKFRYILIPEIINTFMTNISDPVRAKHLLVFKLNLK
jgi:hypothetical protein